MNGCEGTYLLELGLCLGHLECVGVGLVVSFELRALVDVRE
jgi:hypothetical protein